MAFSKSTSPSSDLSADAPPFLCKHTSLASSLADFFRCLCGKTYLQPVRTSELLSDYIKRIATTWAVIFPGYPNIQRLVLTEDVQQLIRRVLAHMPDPENNIRCLSELKAENVRVEIGTGRPFLHEVSWTSYNEDLAKKNYASLAKIIRETIFNGALASLPPDFQQLLRLMETMEHMASYAIQHHCSLVWSVDKKELFSRIYDFSNDILQKRDPTSYAHVMNDLKFSRYWYILIQQNTYLSMFYNGSSYYPNAGKEVLRFKRNTYSHSLQHAWDTETKQQMYDQADLGEMMEAALPLVLHSFQLELDKRGLLRDTTLQSLFH